MAVPDPEWVVPAGGSTQVLAGGQAMTLTDFLLARIAGDETVANAAREHEYLSAARDASPMRWAKDSLGYGAIWVNSGRVLAECEAKRRIVEECKAWSDEWAAENLGGHVLRRLATVYADHPDYREEWKP